MVLFNFQEEVSTHSFVKDDKKILKRQSLGVGNFLWKEQFLENTRLFGKRFVLGSKTLGIKCIRISICNVLVNHDQNIESRFRLAQVWFYVKLESSYCRIYWSKSARLDRLKIRLDRLKIV